MDSLAKVGIGLLALAVLVAAALMALGKAVAWISGGVGLSSGVQAGASLIFDGELLIGLTGTAIVLAALAWYYVSRNGRGGF